MPAEFIYTTYKLSRHYPPDRTVLEDISISFYPGAKIGELPARAYVSSFNFRGTDQQKMVGALPGGERNRVHLAKLLQSGGNVLLLDEPTNGPRYWPTPTPRAYLAKAS